MCGGGGPVSRGCASGTGSAGGRTDGVATAARRETSPPTPTRFCLESPNGRIRCAVTLDGGRPCYSVTFDRERVIGPSPLGLRLAGDGELGIGVSVVRAMRGRIDERYDLIAGKTRTARNQASELVLDMRGQRRLSLIVRAYDAGIAFRYRVPCRNEREAIVLADETTCFDTGDVECWAF